MVEASMDFSLEESEGICAVPGSPACVPHGSLPSVGEEDENTPASGGPLGTLVADLLAGLPENFQKSIQWIASKADQTARQLAGLENEPADSTEVKELGECVHSGVDIRGKYGLRFSRSQDGAKMQTYKDLKTNGEKQQFRKDWAKSEFDKLSETRKQEKCYSKADRNWGRYLAFERIVVEEGNGPRALKRACTYVAKCMLMGGKWLLNDNMTESFKFLYIEVQFVEQFQRSWILCTEHLRHSFRIIKPQSEKGQLEQEAGSASGEPVTPAGDGTKRPLEAETTPQKAQKVARLKSPLEMLLAEAMKTKTQYQEAWTSAVNLDSTMSGDEAWYRAASARAPFDQAMAAVKKGQTPFVFDLTAVKQQGELKKRYTDNALIMECTNF